MVTEKQIQEKINAPQRRGKEMIQSQSVIRRSFKKFTNSILVSAFLVSAGCGSAATLIWTNSSGVFSTASNWDPAQAPATDDRTTFTNDTTYTVSFSGDTPVIDSNVFSNRTGLVTLDLGGSKWTVTNAFRVGLEACTSTVILASGTLDIEAVAPPTSGQLRIGDGTNSVGTLFVTNGIMAYDAVIIGASPASSGKLVIAGPSSVGTSSFSGSPGTLTVGGGGSGCQLIVTNGGKLFCSGTLAVGNNATSTNSFALFSGPNSAGTITSQGLRMTGNGGLLIISNGASLYMAGQGTLGGNSSYNTGIVVGVGSKLVIDGTAGLQVGANTGGGTNNLFWIYDGARLDINTGTLAFGNNTFHVRDGIIIGGPGSPSTGFAVVVRSTSATTNHSDCYVTVTNGFLSTRRIAAQAPVDTITVLANGTLLLTNSLATPPATTNAISLTGGGAQIIVNGGTLANPLTADNGGGISLAGAGSLLVITNGGKVNSSTVALGDSAGFCTGLVSGAGSIWSNFAAVANFTNQLTVGGGAAGSNCYLVVSSGATLYNNGTLNIGNQTNAINNSVLFTTGATVINVGSLNIGSGAASFGNLLTVSNATLNAGTLNVGNTDATNNLFDIRSGTVSANFMRVRPSNTVSVASGTLSLGAMTLDTLANNSNAFVIGDGVNAAYYDMIAGGSGYHNTANSGLVITNGAFLRGNGTLVRNVRVLGTFAPGFSVGTVTASNDLTFGSSAILNYDLGTSNDSVTVWGTLTLGGTINVANAGGFTNTTYTLFTITNTVSGPAGTLTVGTIPSGFNATVSTDTVGSVRLIVTLVGGADPYGTWATYYGLSGGNAAGTADPDGDGMNNTNEFLAGFNPTNSAASLRILNVAKSGSDMTVTYLGANGDSNGSLGPKTNILEFTTGSPSGSYSNDFTSTGQTNILTGGNGGGVVTNMIDAGGATGATRYYRIRVLAP